MRLEKITILIPCCNNENLDLVFGYAEPLSKAFKATITFLFFGDDASFKNFKESTTLYQKSDLADNFIKYIHQTSAYAITPVIEMNYDNEEVMMVIFPQLPTGKINFLNEMSFLFRARKLRLPYMVLPQGTKADWKPSHIYIPVRYDRTDKETAIWASYFARFNKSSLTILYANEKETWAVNNTRLNVLFIKKMFEELGLPYSIQMSICNSQFIHTDAIKQANKKGDAMVVISTTKNYSIEHYLTGPAELKAIKNRENIPVLCINPRKDLYVLCK